MDMEREIASSFSNRTGNFFVDRQEYVQVHALLVHWAENDINPDKELKQLRTQLEQHYHYSVASLPLPGDGKKASYRLIQEILECTQRLSRLENYLYIIYYAGHCEPDEHGNAIWAAFERGGPTLRWHAAQQLLFDIQGDVLLIQDCCHAALVARGVKESGRFELLAACAKGRQTPGPGSTSFTKILVKELAKHQEDGISASDLCSILRENPNITETPVFHDFARKAVSHIKLQPIRESHTHTSKPSSYMLFKASLSSDLSGLQIADWLKTAPPSTVTAVSIEAIVTKARCLQEISKEVDHIFPQESILRKLSPAAQQEILRTFRNLNTTMTVSSRFATDNVDQRGYRDVEDAFRGIETSVDACCEAVATSVLTQLPENDLGNAHSEAIIHNTGTSPAISLRAKVLGVSLSSYVTEFSRDEVDYDPSEPEIHLGSAIQRLALIETYRYDPRPDGNPFQETKTQVHMMASVLSHPKHTLYHILPCLGFFQDRLRHTIGLAFEPPHYMDTSEKPVTLLHLYSRERRVPLGHRIQLAAALTVAFDHFHRVGWVHKGLRSENIAFVACKLTKAPEEDNSSSPDAYARSSTTQLGLFDLGKPCLFGFEYARSGDAGTNLEEDHSLQRNMYRHPERWGRPQQPYRKSHDIYALGIVLTEIAFWRDITSIARLPAKGRIDPKEVQRSILTKCADQLPHQVGEVLYQAIKACFEFGSATEGFCDNEYSVQKWYQTNISNKIRAASGKI